MSSNPSGKITSVGNDSGVHISRENQKKINTFAIRNAWLDELNHELKEKQDDIKNFEDAEADILMFDDDKISIPILVGDCYVHYTQEDATNVIGKLMEKAKNDIKEIASKITSIKREMAELKDDLYSQFGDNISLENDDE